MFGFRSIGVVAFSCAAVSVSAEGLSHFDAGLLTFAPVKTVDQPAKTIGGLQVGDLSTIKLAPQTSDPFSHALPGFSTSGFSLTSAPWQTAHSTLPATSVTPTLDLINRWDSSSWNDMSNLTRSSSTRGRRERPASQLSPGLGSPIMGHGLPEHAWRVDAIRSGVGR
jgi:hypothetical protein